MKPWHLPGLFVSIHLRSSAMSAESKDVWLIKGIGGGALVLLLLVGAVVVLI
ncbi:hypothetical protein [Pseudomonas aeruginosa]|uniref:hypothetical protein n=1 Tax=Pseudomonas aeruginosa TaxID=287 RepID=UPI001F3FD855|nr:hypothetical protein [Pseudomonas aeruginosa]MCF3988088.1 hypothetical protein [Pseudomonas aeruginosa]MCF4004045.1 hypothetical protein [Pseudomonas aeruginosa]